MIINPYRFSAVAGGIPRDNLEIEYLFSSGTTTTPDTSGNGNDCTLVGDASVSGGVIDFSGVAQYGEADNIVSIGTGSMSWSCWLNADSIVNTRGIVRMGRASSSGNARYDGLQILFVNSKISGYLIDYNNSGNDFVIQSSSNLVVGKWHHAVVSLDANAETLELFVDGVSEGSVSLSSIHPWDITAQDPPSIGAREIADGNFTANEFNGRLDNVRLYSDALTAAEVTELFNEGHD
jgi:hypothetical protein